MADEKISQLPLSSALTGSETVAGLQGGDNVQILATAIAQFVLTNPVTTGTSFQIGENTFFTLFPAGDMWLTVNAYYSGGNWNRVHTGNYCYAAAFSWATDIPGETNNTGLMFLRAVPGANPLGPFTSVGGWENCMILDQFRHLVVGGFGIEVDGSGTTPFGRFQHWSNSNVAPKYTGILTNLFIDFSGVDDLTQPSWFIGRIDDGAFIQRAPAGSLVLAQLWSVGNTGMVTENAATVVGDSSPGTALIAAVNIVTSVASGSNVKLATASNPGQKQVIINTTASDVTVNPPMGGTVAGAATVTMATNTQRAFYASSSTAWW